MLHSLLKPVAKECAYNCRLDRICTSLMAAMEAVVDAGVTRCGRVYIAAAAILISLVVAVYFAAVIPEVSREPCCTGHSSGALVLVCDTSAAQTLWQVSIAHLKTVDHSGHW